MAKVDRNVKHSGKPDGAAAIRPQKPGATMIVNDDAKFGNKGHTEGKVPANGVIAQGHGPVFCENSTHIPLPNADRGARHKQIAEKCGTGFPLSQNAEHLTASQSGDGGPTDRPYALKDRYDKKGAGRDGKGHLPKLDA